MDTREHIGLIRQDLDECGIDEVFVCLISDHQKTGTKKMLPRLLFRNKEDMDLYRLVGKYRDTIMELQIQI